MAWVTVVLHMLIAEEAILFLVVVKHIFALNNVQLSSLIHDMYTTHISLHLVAFDISTLSYRTKYMYIFSEVIQDSGRGKPTGVIFDILSILSIFPQVIGAVSSYLSLVECRIDSDNAISSIVWRVHKPSPSQCPYVRKIKISHVHI